MNQLRLKTLNLFYYADGSRIEKPSSLSVTSSLTAPIQLEG
jgi:hypothetical protein